MIITIAVFIITSAVAGYGALLETLTVTPPGEGDYDLAFAATIAAAIGAIAGSGIYCRAKSCPTRRHILIRTPGSISAGVVGATIAALPVGIILAGLGFITNAILPYPTGAAPGSAAVEIVILAATRMMISVIIAAGIASPIVCFMLGRRGSETISPVLPLTRR